MFKGSDVQMFRYAAEEQKVQRWCRVWWWRVRWCSRGAGSAGIGVVGVAVGAPEF